MKWHPSQRKWYESLPWRQKVTCRIFRKASRLEDWLIDQEWSKGWMFPTDGGWFRFVCKVFGHSPITDLCGIPEHDHCSYCRVRTPNKASRS